MERIAPDHNTPSLLTTTPPSLPSLLTLSSLSFPPDGQRYRHPAGSTAVTTAPAPATCCWYSSIGAVPAFICEVHSSLRDSSRRQSRGSCILSCFAVMCKRVIEGGLSDRPLRED